ncbi:MAG: carbon-nitrogen hydrolase family protein [Hyphomicrobiaceae bacterium]
MSAAASLVRVAAAAYPLDALATLGAVEDKIARWVAEAAGAGAEVLVFPEYGAMELAAPAGELVCARLDASLEAVSAARARIDAVHADLAARHRVHILAGSGPRRDADGRYRNSARFFAPSGRSGAQDKLIMTPFEHEWGIVPGEGTRVFETALGRIGIAICYDSEFPLLVRAMVEAGARVILVPACTEFISGYHRIRTAAMARALEGTCASVVSPTVGDSTWSPAVDHNIGAAGIYVPAEAGLSDTGVLAEGPLNAPGWVHATVDLAALAHLAVSGEMRNRADWNLQPGGASALPAAEVVSLL